jgi:hypothetical protein
MKIKANSKKYSVQGLLQQTLILVTCLTLGMVISGGAWAAHEIDNLELEGDSFDDPGNPADDWDSVWEDCQDDPANCTPTRTTALRQSFVKEADPELDETDFTEFPGGTKDTQPISQWACKASSQGPQGKSDILHAYGATYQANGDLIFYGGADRRTTDGESYYGIWLFQEPVGCDSEPNGGALTPFSGNRTAGDLLLVADLLQGGTVSEILAYRWTDPDGVPDSGDECLGNGIDCTNANEGQPIPLSGGNCLAAPDADDACAVTNEGVNPIDLAWRPAVEQNGFFEAGTNLTNLIGDVGCFATAMLETRSSPSLTASLKDFTFLDLATCGTLEVVKETIGGNGSFGFTVEPSAADPDVPSEAFNLATPNSPSIVFPSVELGTYLITETGLPAGPDAPNGWNLTGISCVGGSDPGEVTITDAHAGGFVEIDIDANDDVVCTFTNTFTAPTGSITVEKTCDVSVEGQAQTFDFTLTGFGSSSTADCADGSLTLACGSSITCQDIPADTVFAVQELDEDLPDGWFLSNRVCTGGGCEVQADPNTVGGTLPQDGSVTATFNNVEEASLQVCKQTIPDGLDDEFTFGGSFDFTLSDDDCQTFEGLLPDRESDPNSYTVTETVPVNFLLSDIDCSGSNWSASGPTLTATPAPGEAMTCTFTNTRLIPSIDIQKTPDTQTLPQEGGTAFFTIEVSNTGELDLENVEVTDARAPDCDKMIGDLAVGQSTSYDCSLSGVLASFTNVADVIGDPIDGGDPVEDSDTAGVIVPMPPPEIIPVNSSWALLLLALSILGFAWHRREQLS